MFWVRRQSWASIAANRPKDIDYVRVMIEHRMVGKDRALALARTVPNPEDDLTLSARIIGRVIQMFAGVDQSKAIQVDEVSGRYTGKIISMSDTIAQQEIGLGRIIFHDAAKINALLRLGKTYTIEYKNGRGHATDTNVDKDRTR